jgi:hypothetical protein
LRLALVFGHFSAVPTTHSPFRNAIIERAACMHFTNFYTACDFAMDHRRYTVWNCMALGSPQGTTALLRCCQKYTFSYLIHLDDHSPNTFSLNWRCRRAGSG